MSIERTEPQPPTLAAGASTAVAAGTLPAGAPVDGTVMPTPEAAEAARRASLRDKIDGLKLPGYKLVRELGSGTYGAVWLAEDEHVPGRLVAVKFLSQQFTRRTELMLQEAKQLAMLDGAFGIIHLKDVEPHADPPYFVMSYAAGGSLAALLEARPGRALPAAEALPLFTQVVRAMAFVHAKGIRHCDLKPANILLDDAGRPLVADFGQAHLASDLSPALGTFFYMAPEQATTQRSLPDARWDVYALGAIFHTMLTGGPPHADETVRQELKDTAVLDHRLRRYRDYVTGQGRPAGHRRVPGVDRRLAEVIDRSLDPEPARRYRSAGDLLEALEQRRTGRQRRRLQTFALTVALLALALMLLGAAVLFRDITARAKATVSAQVRENEQTAARSVALLAQDKLRDQVDELKRFARENDAPLRRAVRPGPAGPNQRRSLRDDPVPELHRRLQALAADRSSDLGFTMLRVLDRWGYQVYRVKRDNGPNDDDERAKVAEKRWAWRDYFNGGGDRTGAADKAKEFSPITDIHISQPYASEMANLDKRSLDHGLVDISVPIIEGGEVVGVLAGAIRYDYIQKLFEGVTGNRRDRFLVLVNDRDHLLFYREPGRGMPERGRTRRATSGSARSRARAARRRTSTTRSSRGATWSVTPRSSPCRANAGWWSYNRSRSRRWSRSGTSGSRWWSSPWAWWRCGR